MLSTVTSLLEDMNYYVRLAKFAFCIIPFLLYGIHNVCAHDDWYEVDITLENHKFSPSIVHVPQYRKIKLVIYNVDSTIEEFDSSDLKREKILRPMAKTNIILAPLKAGRYDFMGEFHEDTAKGTIIVE